jgi:uncharacterized phage-associated protein
MNIEKYTNAILFFAKSTPNLGIIKLNKLLYFLDFDHFEKYGEAVTDDVYINKSFGPVPQHSDDVLKLLREQGKITVAVEQVIDYTRYHIIANSDYSPDVFKPTEMAMLCEVKEKWSHLTAKEIVAATHGEAPWIATRQDEVIPYALAYYRGKYDSDSGIEAEVESEPKLIAA